GRGDSLASAAAAAVRRAVRGLQSHPGEGGPAPCRLRRRLAAPAAGAARRSGRPRAGGAAREHGRADRAAPRRTRLLNQHLAPVSGDPAAALLDLHRRISGCTVCPLARTRTHAVPGEGPHTARIMAVGEAPGEREDLSGRPFVGSAGQLLTRLLESVGLQRSDLYICNVLKCRPPGNRDPEPAEVDACAHFLDEQIAVIRPDVILLLGRHAVARLLPGLPGISRL